MQKKNYFLGFMLNISSNQFRYGIIIEPQSSMHFRKVELKKTFVFIATKNKSLRTVKVKAHAYAEAEEIIKKKYPDWVLSPYGEK